MEYLRTPALARRGAIAGIDFCEVVPALDIRDLTSIFASRLILNFIGAMAHSGRIGRIQGGKT